jgi:hypothetical protein
LAIDFLAIGHLTHDRTPNGFRLGGTVSYAAVTALRLKRKPGVLTCGTLIGADGLRPPLPGQGANETQQFPKGIELHVAPSEVSTTFSNIYDGGRRRQVIEALADPVRIEMLPPSWVDVPVVLLGPIANELTEEWLTAFPRSLLGITPQGWMRKWDSVGNVSPTRWCDAAPFLARADAVILSREDVGGDDSYLAQLASQTKLLVVTDGWHGATLYTNGETIPVPPRSTDEVDPTGAGDVFATAFLIRLDETSDPLKAAHFATVVASMSVEASGIDGIPDRKRVEKSLAIGS